MRIKFKIKIFVAIIITIIILVIIAIIEGHHSLGEIIDWIVDGLSNAMMYHFI